MKFTGFFVASLAIFLFSHPVMAGTEIQITNDSVRDSFPDISGDYIVYRKDYGNNGKFDLAVYDLAEKKESRITTTGSVDGLPSISGNQIVWEDNRRSPWSDVYMYDLDSKTETRVTFYYGWGHPAKAPKISGNRVVWFDGYNGAIVVYDLVTNSEIKSINNLGNLGDFTFSGDKVLWMAGFPTYHLYLYDIAADTKIQLPASLAEQSTPRIDGNTIVYVDRPNWNYDVYTYDAETQSTSPVAVGVGDQFYPSISGNKVVYSDNRSGHTGIYSYDLTTEIEELVTSNSVSRTSISGNRIVWTDQRNGNVDIYMYDLNPNVAPTAQISLVPTVMLGESVAFDGSGSSDSDGTVASYQWDFGDGNTSSGVTTSHVYGAAGIYQVILTVTDDDGAADTATVTVMVNAPPVAVIAPVTEIAHGQVSSFDGSGSTDSDGTITSYSWNFGDGNTGTGATTTHTYANAGTYTATLAVMDNDGATDEATVSAVVDALPEAGIVPIAMVIVGETTSFDGSDSNDSDGNIVSYVWNFGDSSTGNGETTTHTYSSVGSYTVTLTATDDFGSTDTVTATAVVQTPAQAIDDLTSLVESMNLAQGISNSLDSKLENAADALSAMNSGSTNSAIAKLEAFINSCQAQSGNQLTIEQANQLIAAATRIINTLQ